MILEYLTSNECIPDVTELGDFKDKGILYETFGFNENKSYITTFLIENDNEKSAKILSKLNTHIIGEYKPTTLTNESSSYFNRRLSPLINDFERKLRKLLYLYISISEDEKANQLVEDLEKQDLGKIFENIFTDKDFNNKVRENIKSKTWQFTKNEIEENTVWNNILGKDKIKILVENFVTVKDYRNDVMHAHNIDYDCYKKSKNLFKKINQQLDIEIGNISGMSTPDVDYVDIANNLSDALKIVSNFTEFFSIDISNMADIIANGIAKSTEQSKLKQDELFELILKLISG